MAVSQCIEAFRSEISEEQLTDVRERLRRTRWPDSTGSGWEDGTDLAYLRELVDYWIERFDWRAQEARLNAFPQFRVQLDGFGIHVIHVRGKGPAPLPLILTHGWPGSVFEMLNIVPRLTDPERYGGRPEDAFDLVVPSLPGYGFSDRPRSPGMNPHTIADLWADLMSALGYERFGAQGGDWGAGVSTQLAIAHPQRLIGVHLNYMMRSFLTGPSFEPDGLDPAERAYFAHVERWTASEGGYAHIQGTKPQTVAYALNDSPAGLAGWIVEKFRTWSDCEGDLESVFSKDELLANVALYWFTQTIGSSMRLYRERQLKPPQPAEGGRPPTPFGFAAFPKELATPPRTLIERAFALQRYTTMPRGGHFAALEEPELLAGEIAAFFRPLR